MNESQCRRSEQIWVQDHDEHEFAQSSEPVMGFSHTYSC
jgi:hypothetical protein